MKKFRLTKHQIQIMKECQNYHWLEYAFLFRSAYNKSGWTLVFNFKKPKYSAIGHYYDEGKCCYYGRIDPGTMKAFFDNGLLRYSSMLRVLYNCEKACQFAYEIK